MNNLTLYPLMEAEVKKGEVLHIGPAFFSDTKNFKIKIVQFLKIILYFSNMKRVPAIHKKSKTKSSKEKYNPQFVFFYGRNSKALGELDKAVRARCKDFKIKEN